MSETCPVCGGPVIHHVGGEGTHSYESTAEAALCEAREELVGLHTLEDQYEDAIQKLREAREWQITHEAVWERLPKTVQQIYMREYRAALARAGEQE